MAKAETIQFDTSDSVVGGENVVQAIETEQSVCFNESYTVIGRKFRAKRVYATYDLAVIGDLIADNIEINGDLLVNGNIKANLVRCTRLTCTGKINVKELICAEDVLAKNLTVDDVQSQGSIIVSDSLNIYEKCDVARNVIAGVGISGNGELKADNSIAGDFFDFDGDMFCHVIEVSTIGEDQHDIPEDETNEEIPLARELSNFLSKFVEENIEHEEEYILEKIGECAKVQRLSFDEMYNLINEIDRISYYNKINNFRDYLLVKYAEELLPEAFKEYETLSHVFTTLIKDLDVDELEYSADSIEEFIMSLKILISIFDDIDEYAEKIFSFIGLKYSFVKKQFER